MHKIWFWSVLIAVGGFLFGFDTGVISGALLYIKSDFSLNSFEQGSVVSVLVLGAMVGSLTAGRIADRIGRQKTIGLEGAVFLAGTAIAVLANGYVALMAGRIVLGLAVGGASATVPLYLSEISPKNIRGRVLTLNQLMITVGILVAYMVNLIFSGSGNWRAMIAAGGIPAFVMIVASLWVLPESYQWLLARGRDKEAHRLVASVTGTEIADIAVRRFKEQMQRHADSPEAKTEGKGWHVLLSPHVRPALIVAVVLAVVQQFGGINTIIYYAPTIIQETGLTASNSIFYSIAIGVINLVMTIVAITLVDRTGRRPLLLHSLLAMTITMALLGLAFVAGWPSLLTLVFMVLYIGGFAAGLGPVFWDLIAEVYPPEARAAGSAAATAVNWLSNFTVSLVFLPIANAIGQGQTFWIFGVISLLGLLFVKRFVPETKGRDIDQVTADLAQRFGHAKT
ncbi:sugar porter family MFS transporter [Actinomadura macrotermitis]|nr:sugar porter family MFS transporter [Actinomadura macrotermitis]